MRNIKLQSRYGEVRILAEIEKNKFVFTSSIGCLRVCHTEKKNELEFIDPDGGPMLSKNDLLMCTNDQLVYIKKIIYDEDLQKYCLITKNKKK